MRDRAEKFRSDRTKVTKEQVQEIRKSSLSQAQLAKKFGMTRQGIWRIIHRKSYFWLE
jgi:transcriptional regulator with XRE-family HTH domain